MISYIFDTSFLISLLDIDDINHQKAISDISDIEIGSAASKFYINDVILNEAYTVLNYKKWFEFLTKLDIFLDKIQVIYISSNNEEYLSFFKFLRGKVSVADGSVIYDSMKYDLKMLTFDKEMMKLEKTL